MSTVRFDWATPDDDGAIRSLLRDSTVPGEVALSFQREPSYFAGDGCLGRSCETLVARDAGAVVAVAGSAVRFAYVGGEADEVGYLGGLRVAASHQGRGLVSRGWRELRGRLCARGVPGAFATLSHGNVAAQHVLVARAERRAGGFVPLTTLHTLTYAASSRAPRPAGVTVTTGRVEDVDEAVAFLGRHGPRRQLFPVVAPEDLAGALPGLQPDDLLIARRGGAPAGLLAVWDQSAVRQAVVRGYGPRLTRLKSLVDLTRLARGARRLPRVGSALRVACASYLCVAGDDPIVAAALIAAGVQQARAKGAHAFALALTDEDPLLSVARRRRHVAYRSRVLVAPLADPSFVSRLEGVRFVDVGTI